MRAPVYRNIEAESTLLGLAFPFELLAFLGGVVAFIQFLPVLLMLVASAGLYAAIRVASHGRPPMFLQHWMLWHFRQVVLTVRISAAARASSPQFPFGPYQSLDNAVMEVRP